MKKLLLLSIFLPLAGMAQVGIGTTTPTEKLEVNGNFKDSSFSTTWTPSISYDSNYVVLYQGNFYKHISTTNTATAPSTDTANWRNIAPQTIASNADVDTTPHAQQTTIADGAALRYNSGTGKWEADVVEGFANNNVAFTTPWGFELKMDQSNQQAYFRNATGTIKFFAKRTGYMRVTDQVGNPGTGQTQSPIMGSGWISIWQDGTLAMNDMGDYEFMRFTWADDSGAMAAGDYEEYEVMLVVGAGYNNNYFRVQKLK